MPDFFCLRIIMMAGMNDAIVEAAAITAQLTGNWACPHEIWSDACQKNGFPCLGHIVSLIFSWCLIRLLLDTPPNRKDGQRKNLPAAIAISGHVIIPYLFNTLEIQGIQMWCARVENEFPQTVLPQRF